METHTTKDQKIYRLAGRWKAKIDIVLPHEEADTPSVQEYRHAVLPLHGEDRYIIFDRLLGRIVDGVYSILPEALAMAHHYNTNEHAAQDMTPNSAALGLIYPKKRKQP